MCVSSSKILIKRLKCLLLLACGCWLLASVSATFAAAAATAVVMTVPS